MSALGKDFIKLYNDGMTYAQIAEKYGVTRSAVSGCIARTRRAMPRRGPGRPPKFATAVRAPSNFVKPRQPRKLDKVISARIRYCRMQKGKSQDDIAHAIGISFQSVQRYEYGTSRVSAATLYAIAEYLQMPLRLFFEPVPVISNQSVKKLEAA